MEAAAPKHASLKQRALEELKAYWLITLYLFVFLGSFTIYRRLILKELGVVYLNYGFALIEALIIAKIILIGRVFGWGKRFESGPLILSVLYKSVLFGVLVLAFSVVEHGVEGLFRGKGFSGGVGEIWSLGNAELLARVMVLIVAFVPFFAFWEIGRVIGAERLTAMFFSKHGSAASSQSHE